MPALLRFFLPYVVSAIIAFMLGMIITSYFATKRYNALEVRFLNYQVAQADAFSEAQTRANTQREKQEKTIKDLETAVLKKAESDAKTIRDLHARYDRLRIAKPNCPSNPSVPEATDSSISDGTHTEREFLEANGRSFIELAERAERIRVQALTCQQWARSLME